MKGSAIADKVSGAMKDVSFYVLGADLNARGIDESKLIDGVKVVDYSGFVQLTVDSDKVSAWT
jgi:tRNA 2-thiouridine synthesizing protein B